MLAVDYVSKWVEAVPMPTNDAKTIIKFLKKNIFSRFGVPRVLISDGGSHFCNAQLKKVLEHFNVKHRVPSPYILNQMDKQRCQIEKSRGSLRRQLLPQERIGLSS